MDHYVYQDLQELQEQHWWFKARRELLSEVLNSLMIPSNSDILEIGCGTGGNLSMLSDFGNVCGMEMHEEAAQYAQKVTGQDVRSGSLPGSVPFEKKFDLVCLLDVLEHIEDDELAVSSLKKLLKPGGRVVITVPAYQWMFGKHDILLHHFRRYSRGKLAALFSSNDIEIEKLSYFNTLLFPLAAMASFMDSVFSVEKCTGYSTPPTWINSAFYNIFRLEKLMIDALNLPFGCSLLLVSKPVH
jgi:SAM-dependent methyltransferase